MISNRLLRYGTALFLLVGCVILLKQNHANWIEASRITRLCLSELPPAPQGGARWIHGLPGDHQGAFIFRNGFPEALALTGSAADDVVVVPPDSASRTSFTNPAVYRGKVHRFGRNDVTLHWSGSHYTEGVRMP
ncbi:MAG: hypothetical protein ACO1NQ_02465 [Flavobacteriales bacterium]